MSKKVRDLRLRLEALSAARPDLSEEMVTTFLQRLADLDDMTIEAFLKRVFKKPTAAARARAPAVDTDLLVQQLRSALSDDDLFHDELQKLGAQRSVTKSILTQIYYVLFNRSRGVPSKSTRADLLRLIEDERNKLVRDGKMRELLIGRAVPAE